MSKSTVGGQPISRQTNIVYYEFIVAAAKSEGSIITPSPAERCYQRALSLSRGITISTQSRGMGGD